MNTKQTNLLFISLLFLAGISTVVGAAEEDADLVRVPEDGLKQMAFLSEKIGITKNFLTMLETASPESKNSLLRGYSSTGSSRMVQCLVRANADVSAKNKDDWSALTLATRNRNKKVVKYLLNEGGANVDIKSRNDRTSLMEAAMDDWSEGVKLFIEKKAKLGEKT